VKRLLTIGITSVALAATLSVVTVRGEVLSVSPVAQPTVYAPRYDFGPRIIHVPQPGEEDAASVPHVRRVMPDDDDDAEERATPPRRQSAPRPQRQKTSDTPPAPRRKPYNVAVPERPAPAERRTVLRAPVHDGPTPVKPTPRFAKETGAKFPPPPPPGYTPPANLPQEPAPAETAAQEPVQEPALDAAPQGE
jgi:hypothetical protein